MRKDNTQKKKLPELRHRQTLYCINVLYTVKYEITNGKVNTNQIEMGCCDNSYENNIC